MRLFWSSFSILFVWFALAIPAFAQSTNSPTAANPPRASVTAKPSSSTVPDRPSGTVGTAVGSASSDKESGAPSPTAKGAGAPPPPTASAAGPDASATPTGASPSPASAGVDAGTFRVRLRELEQRIDDLKLQIRRSHTRLSLLSETILSGGTGGAKASISFVNDMSSAFRLTQALFVLDGAVQYNKQDDTGILAAQKDIPIFSGSIPPGDHTLQILVKFRGHGFSVFSYLEGYTFQIRETHSFTVAEGKAVTLRAIAFEKGDATTPIEQRPGIRYHQAMDAVSAVPGADSGRAEGMKTSVSAGSK
jgi:hypothetical protein